MKMTGSNEERRDLVLGGAEGRLTAEAPDGEGIVADVFMRVRRWPSFAGRSASSRP
jgi:hypothetical protein